MENNKFAYSPCKFAKKHSKKCIKCKIDGSQRRVDKRRGPNSCISTRCPYFKKKLSVRLRKILKEFLINIRCYI